jgi:hypothetical protein
MEGRLQGLGHCFIVGGSRGVGRTFFLKSLANAGQKRAVRTLVCWINYKTMQLHEVAPSVHVFFRERWGSSPNYNPSVIPNLDKFQ